MQTPATTDRAIMGSLKRKRDDPGADVVPATIVYLKRGDLSILSAISAELPDVFTEHLLPKLGLRSHAQLSAGEQDVQGRGVERGWRSIVRGED
jgi:hypothetical protein